MKSLKIMVVEDDAVIAEDLCHCLEELGHTAVGPAYEANEAINLLHKQLPQLALLDIHLKNHMDGIELAAWMNANRPIPFIFLTAFADEITLDRAKEVHPAHYLIKPFDRVRLKIAIEIANSNYYTPDFMHQLSRRLYKFSLQLPNPLSDREIEVLKFLGEGYSNREIAEKLFVSEHTIKSHLKSIFLKTNAKSRTDLISKLHHL